MILFITQFGCNTKTEKYKNQTQSTEDQTIEINDGLEFFIGFIIIDTSNTHSIQAKKYGGNYYLADKKEGGNRIALYAPWYDQASKLLGKKILIKGEKRNSKIGEYLLVDRFEIIKD